MTMDLAKYAMKKTIKYEMELVELMYMYKK